MAYKAVLMEVVEAGQAELLRFARVLSEEERSTSGTTTDWTHRDYLVHMAGWKRRIAGRLAAARQGNAVQEEETQAINDAIYEKYRAAPWSEIEELVVRSHHELMLQLQSFSEEELNAAGRFPGARRPLWRSVAANGLLHPMAHLGSIYIERGELEYVDAMRRREAALVSGLDDSPEWKAIAQFNLACHHALMGNKQKALDHLEPSLQLDPRLVEDARQDIDLVSLRGDPDFNALLERVEAARKTG